MPDQRCCTAYGIKASEPVPLGQDTGSMGSTLGPDMEPAPIKRPRFMVPSSPKLGALPGLSDVLSSLPSLDGGGLSVPASHPGTDTTLAVTPAHRSFLSELQYLALDYQLARLYSDYKQD